MAFVRVNPGGWAVGDVLTSAQQNELDIDHANSLDKTTAGDTISGDIILASTAALLCGFTGNIVASAGGAIQATFAGAIESLTVGGFEFNGGTSDYGALNPLRTRVVRILPIPLGMLLSDWVMTASGATNDPELDGTAAATPINLAMPVHNGSTLTTVKAWLQVGNTHSVTPFAFPSFDIRRVPIATGLGSVSMFSGGPVFASAATGAAWFNSGNAQSWQGTCNQNNVIDTTQFGYNIRLIDENGANAKPANTYLGFEFTFTGIGSLAFP